MDTIMEKNILNQGFCAWYNEFNYSSEDRSLSFENNVYWKNYY